MTTSDRVPREFPIGINGTPFQLDDSSNAFGLSTIPVLQRLPYAQSDAATTDPSARTSRFTDWSHGAGQTFWDDPASDQARFRQSQGVDPWTPGKLSLLNDVTSVASPANCLQAWQISNGRRYYVDGNNLALYETTTQTGSASFSSVVSTVNADGSRTGPYRIGCTDGTSSYIITGPGSSITNITKRSAAGSNSTFVASPPSGIPRFLAFAKGRLLLGVDASSTPKVYDCTSGTATLVVTLNDTSEYLMNAAGAGDHIYIATRGVTHSTIYSVKPDPDTTALTLTGTAAELPNGELIQDIFGYAGLLFIGTQLGFRVAVPLSDGSLQIGSLVQPASSGISGQTYSPVYQFCAWGQFVWFTWTYTTTAYGLGRIDPTTFTDPAGIVPAYATDIMKTGSNVLSNWCMMEMNSSSQPVPAFGNTASFFDRNNSAVVASATIDLGFTSYNLTEPKTATAVDLRTEALPANASVAVSLTNVSGGSPSSISTYSTTSGSGTLMTVANIVGREHEIRLTLATTGTAPVVTATTLLATPRPTGRGELWKIPVLIGTDIADNNGNNQKFDPFTIIAMLRTAANSTDPVDVQIGTYSDTMLVEDFEFHGYSWLLEGAPAMTGLVTLKNLSA